MEEDTTCTFNFVDAGFLCAYNQSVSLPHFQKLQRDFPEALHKKTYCMSKVVAGHYVKEDLMLSPPARMVMSSALWH